MDDTFVELLRPRLKFAADRPIAADTGLREWGLDSMQAIELLFDIEDAYGVTLPEDELTDRTFATAGSLWNAVSRGARAVGPAA
ncbi:MAG TPA: acyl carrier protein [Pilimelia sp.]|nr:acyl carrier protein [Pilimelia sp.]